MKPDKQHPVPPALPRPRRSKSVWYALLALAAAALLANYSLAASVFPYRCGLKTLTGIPCAFCGGTRSLAALGRLEFLEAFLLNPLVFLGVLMVPVWCLMEVMGQPAWLQRTRAGLRSRKGTRILWLAAATALVGNWLFLLWQGR